MSKTTNSAKGAAKVPAADDTSPRVSFNLPQELFDSLAAQAESEGLAMASHIRRILVLRQQTLAAQAGESQTVAKVA